MAGLLDFLQSASNAAASTVTGNVDALAWLLKKAGVDVGEPFGGSDWAKRKGLMRDVPQSGASLAGETAGLLGPIAVAAKAPQIARGLLQAGENLAAPRTMSAGMAGGERGMVPGKWGKAYHATRTPFDPPQFDPARAASSSGHASADVQGMWASSTPEIANIFAFNSLQNRYPTSRYGSAGAGVKAIALKDVKEGAAVMPMKVKVQNPVVLSNKEAQKLIFGGQADDWRETGAAFREFAESAKAAGHDSVIIKGNPMSSVLELRSDQVLMFDPKSQAKSVFDKAR